MQTNFIRIGVFYDGNYFNQVNNYYAYGHARRTRISIAGLHEFIKHSVALEEGTQMRFCQIVDSHYFKGRLSAHEANQKGDMIYWERAFEDILTSEGVTTHYLPVKTLPDGQKQEKGIDVWLALEAYELATYKQFNVVVLISSDGDYVPLVRKLNTLGVRAMVLSWDFDYTSESGYKYSTRTSADLLREVPYPLLMHQIIDKPDKKYNKEIIDAIFIRQDSGKPEKVKKSQDDKTISEIMNLRNGYGFIKQPPNNIFFHFSELQNADFNDLRVGDKVSFLVDKNPEGQEIAVQIEVLGESE